MSDSVQPHRRQPSRLPHPWDFPGKSTGVGCHCLLWKWTGMDEFNSDDHYIYYCRQESLRRNGVALNKRAWNAVLGCSLQNSRMICVHFQGKPFNITVIQAYAPSSKAESWSWMVLWRPTRPSRINSLKRCPFHHRDWSSKVGSQDIPRVAGKFGLGVQNKAAQRLTEFCQENALS